MTRYLMPLIVLPMIVAVPAFAVPAARSAGARTGTPTPAPRRGPVSTVANERETRPPVPACDAICTLRSSLRRPDFQALEIEVGRSAFAPKEAKARRRNAAVPWETMGARPAPK